MMSEILQSVGVETEPRVCDDIRAWCIQHPTASYSEVYAGRPLHRKLPRTSGASLEALFKPLCDVQAPARGIVRVPKARITGKNGLVILPDNQYVGELLAMTPEGRRKMLRQQDGFTVSPPAPERILTGNYYLALGVGWQNYYHWNHDVIMRLWRVLEQLPKDIQFLIPPRLKPFQMETLKMVGIPAERQVAFEGNALWEIDQLYFSTPIFKTQIDIPEPMTWFRDLCRTEYRVRPYRQKKRIFLTRKRDTHYQLTNEAEVLAELAQYGFEVCNPGRMTLTEQTSYFSQAESIAGTGTGLMNMVFAPKGAKILQFQEPSVPIHALWTMSEALGHSYWCLMGETVPTDKHELANIFVPMDALHKTLKAMGYSATETSVRKKLKLL